VSIQLKRLQEQFTIPLTEIIGRKLYVTDFGREIAEAAKNIIAEVEAINYKTLAYQNELTGKLKVSSASTGKYVAPYFLSGFVNQHRGVDLVMDVTNKTRVVQSLERNEIDFALVSVIPEDLKTESLSLIKNKLYLVGSPSMTKKLSPKADAFEGHSLLYREKGSATRNAMESFIRINGLPTSKKLELTSNEAVKQAVIAGIGCSIMPLIGLRNELKNNEIEIIPFRGLPVVTHWNIIWLKDKKLSPVAQAFLDYLRQNMDQIIEDNFKWYEEY